MPEVSEMTLAIYRLNRTTGERTELSHVDSSPMAIRASTTGPGERFRWERWEFVSCTFVSVLAKLLSDGDRSLPGRRTPRSPNFDFNC